MLKSILCASDEVDFVSELLMLGPWWLHQDLNSVIRKHVGDLARPGAVDKLMKRLYSDDYDGQHWAPIKRDIDREMLREELSKDPSGIKALLRAIMVVHARKKGKPRIGAKFPLHYSYAHKLLEWFPDCQLIHTTRNPKAVYASQSAKYITPELGFATRLYSRVQQFAHINIQIAWTASLHRKLCVLPNYRLVRYEDVVLEPEETLRSLCDFIGISLTDKMLSPHQFNSSFQEVGNDRRGIDKSSLERWRTTISPATAFIIDAGHRRANRMFGYND